ncbi:MAG TPA: MT-A70 family methyltransferase [Stellaceae bacterium]|nr:MT-A70 family methyltransferase [Stellaceae bacterium]
MDLPPSRRYPVICADPPWTFATYSRKGKGRSPEAYYDCMTLADIEALPVGEWAARDCVLFLWAIDPLLDKAFEVIRAWGFTYKTIGFYWAKLNKSAPSLVYDEKSFFTGLGFWTRANPEPCLLATRGKPRRRRADVKKLIVAPRRQHSRKPDEAYARIEALCEGPYLELFARGARPGWDSWGREAGGEGSTISPRRWASNSYPDPPGPSADSILKPSPGPFRSAR